MNVLLVNYGQADNNSAYHILGFARGLTARGHDVCVAVAKSVPDGEFERRDGFRLASQRTVLKLGPGFANRKPADVLHLWTPRETMRQFAMAYRTAWRYGALVVHLEDNEEAIFERFTGHSIAKAIAADQSWPKGLIHPGYYRDFLESAQGATLVHGCLGPLVPEGMPSQEIVPIMDEAFISDGSRDREQRRRLGITDACQVVVFNGNDHAAAAMDIRQLYEAIDLLIERGRDVTFVRTGHVLPANYDGLQFRPGPRCHELGFIPRGEVPAIMRMADVVIQPGDGDMFNSYRLPAKVPEYLSMGKPLIMGTGNIGHELAADRAAFVLPRMDPHSMADCVEWVLNHPHEAATIGSRGSRFAQKRFNESVVISALEAFYEKVSKPRSLPPSTSAVPGAHPTSGYPSAGDGHTRQPGADKEPRGARVVQG